MRSMGMHILIEAVLDSWIVLKFCLIFCTRSKSVHPNLRHQSIRLGRDLFKTKIPVGFPCCASVLRERREKFTVISRCKV